MTNTASTSDMYRDNILDHFNNPRNLGKINNANIVYKDYNPLCGDLIKIYMKVENDVIKDFKFEAEGCAISLASSSMLSEVIIGKNLNDVINLKNEDVFKLLNIQLSPIRIKCALLSLLAIKKAVYQYKEIESKNE